MATQNITYTDKEQGQVNPKPVEQKFTFEDANEIKNVVNNNATELNNLDGTNIELIKGGGIYVDDAIVSLQTDVNTNSTALNNLDGTNIEIIKGGGIYIDDAIVDLQDDVNANSTTLNNLDGTNIEVVKGGSLFIDDAIVGLQDTKVDLGGDIGGTVTNPTINNEAITNDKLAHIPTNRIKGRASSGNGDVEDLTVPQTKSMLSIDNVDNTSDLDKPISTATATALNTLDLDLTSLDNAKISKNVGTTYTTNALTTVTQSEYDALTPDSATIYFII